MPTFKRITCDFVLFLFANIYKEKTKDKALLYMQEPSFCSMLNIVFQSKLTKNYDTYIEMHVFLPAAEVVGHFLGNKKKRIKRQMGFEINFLIGKYMLSSIDRKFAFYCNKSITRNMCEHGLRLHSTWRQKKQRQQHLCR